LNGPHNIHDTLKYSINKKILEGKWPSNSGYTMLVTGGQDGGMTMVRTSTRFGSFNYSDPDDGPLPKNIFRLRLIGSHATSKPCVGNRTNNVY
jgi:hypothetical protein